MAKPPKKQTDLIWASEIMEVFQNLGVDVINQQWSTKSAKYIHTWVREHEKNEEKFLVTMVPKATDILAKHGLADAADAVLEIDAKTVRDLKLLLADAVSASQVDISPIAIMNATTIAAMGEGIVTSHVLQSQPDVTEPVNNCFDIEHDTELEPEPSIEDLF